MAKRLPILLAMCGVLGAACTAPGAIVDHFDDGQLTGWTITYGGGSNGAWTRTESGTNLTVTSVGHATNGAGTWADVYLTRGVDDADGDFAARMTFAYQQPGSSATAQMLLRALDAGGNEIAFVGFLDGWTGFTGVKYSRIGTTTYTSGKYNERPFSDVVTVEIARTAGVLTTRYKGTILQTLAVPTTIAQLQLQISHVEYAGEPLGTFDIDMVEYDLPSPVPTPAAFSGGAALLMFIATRRR